MIVLLAQAMTATPLVPPRPNLGPEPMHSPASHLGTLLGLAAATIILGALIVRLMRRSRKKRTQISVSDRTTDSKPALSSDPRIRLIIFAEMLRNALVERFGPHWAAKTTQEILAETQLDALLGSERLEQLAHVLREGDRAKFSWKLCEATQGEDLEPLVRALVDEITRAAGATSMIKGK